MNKLTQKEWLLFARKCEWRIWERQFVEHTIGGYGYYSFKDKGNPLCCCGAIGKRCMYRLCTEKDKVQELKEAK